MKKYPKGMFESGCDGSITHLFIANYASQYRGFVSNIDKDYTVLYNGKFYSFDDKDHMSLLRPEHKYGLYKYFSKNAVFESSMNRSKLPDDVFGIPQERKYPMPDKEHTLSAIKFFNRVESKYEKQLANNILSNMAKYGINPAVIGSHNRLRKYI